MSADRTHTLRTVYYPATNCWFALVDGIPGLVGEGYTKDIAIWEALCMYDDWIFSKLLRERSATLHEVVVSGVCGCSANEYCTACEEDDLVELIPDEN